MASTDADVKEQWEQELNEDGSRRFETYGQYEKYYVRLVEDLYEESRRAFKPIKQRWMEADKRLELDKLFEMSSFGSATRTDIALVPQAVEKRISLLVENLPRPQIGPRQAGQEDMVGAINYFMNEVLDQNQFDMLVARIALDMARFNIGVIKITTDENGFGPFGEEGRIIMSKCDPRYVWPDPFAKSWRWEDMKYLCVAEPHDLSDIRLRYGKAGRRVEAESFYSLKRETLDGDEDMSGILQTSNESGHKIGERERVLVKELWLKDNSLMWEPICDENGEQALDADGKPLLRQVPRYPRGRLIVVANGVILLDCHNPFTHPRPPYAFFLNRLSTRLFSFGDVELLARLEDKVNVLHKDCMRNARTNMNSPWLVDHGAFDSPEMYKNLTNEEGLIIEKAPQSNVSRLPAAELPGFVFPLMGWLTGIFNDLSGVSNIMQGQLEKGSQLSADAIAGLQGAASGNLRIKARLFETGLEDVGYLLSFDIRDLYDSEKNFTLTDPKSGETKEISWTPGKMEGEYPVEVTAGSSLPGAKAGAQQQAITLWDHDLIDRQAALDQMQYPGRGVIVKRMADRQTQLAVLGIEAKDGGSKTGRAGRKSGSYNI